MCCTYIQPQVRVRGYLLTTLLHTYVDFHLSDSHMVADTVVKKRGDVWLVERRNTPRWGMGNGKWEMGKWRMINTHPAIRELSQPSGGHVQRSPANVGGRTW